MLEETLTIGKGLFFIYFTIFRGIIWITLLLMEMYLIFSGIYVKCCIK